MDLPIKFPNDADVIAEESARFRPLTPSDQIKAIRKCCDDFESYLKATGQEAEYRRLADENKRLEREAILQFIARHYPNQLGSEARSIDESDAPDMPIIIERGIVLCS